MVSDIDVFTLKAFSYGSSFASCLPAVFFSSILSCWASFPRMTGVISLFRNDLTKWMHMTRNKSSVFVY